MMNRRQFVCAAAAGPAVFARAVELFAADSKYDLIVKGGRVIDPSVRLDATRDVAIAGGRIAAVEANIAADGAAVIDARGKLVVPGLIDIHTHAARIKDGPALCLADGVTGFVDAYYTYNLNTIAGANFSPGATVSFGDAPAAQVTVNSTASITVTTPAHAVGQVDLQPLR